MTFVERVVRWDFPNFLYTYVLVPVGWMIGDIIQLRYVHFDRAAVAFLFIMCTLLYGLYNWVDTKFSESFDE